jgi:ABC-type sugar transport system substrate-binding protein
MLNPVDPKALVPAVKYARARNEGLSVYATMPSANASVVFDEIRSGRVAAEYAATLLKKRYGKLTGKVAVLEESSANRRATCAQGFIDWMKAHGVRSRPHSPRTGPPTRPPRRCRTGSSSILTCRWSTA